MTATPNAHLTHGTKHTSTAAAYRERNARAAGKLQDKAQENNMCAAPPPPPPLICLYQILHRSSEKHWAIFMQITPITGQYRACEYRRARSCVMPRLLGLPTEAPVWTASPSLSSTEDLTLREKTTITPPLKQKSGNCPNRLPRHK